MTQTTQRDSKGRWLKGASGNPKGRPLGAKDTYWRTRDSGYQPWASYNLPHWRRMGWPKRPANMTHDEKIKELIEIKAMVKQKPMPTLAELSRLLSRLCSLE